MPHNANRIGTRGESIFLTRILEGTIINEAFFLGEKAEAIDFLCQISDNLKTYSFKIQVKATTLGYNKRNRNLKIKVDIKTINALKADILPTYIAGVDVNDEKVYLWGIFNQNKKISSLPTNYKLELHGPNNGNVLNRLKEDVLNYWDNHNPQPKATYQSLLA